MQFGAVALVLVETILGKLRAEVTHDSVARHFGDHARGRDGQTGAIAVDDRRLWKRKWKNWETVEQNMLRRERQRAERDPHRFLRCAQNIDSIDFEMIDNADGPGDFAIRNQLIVNFFTKLWAKLFGIVQFAVPEFLGQYGCGRDNWAGQCSATRFIDAGDSNDSGGAQFPFVTKSAAPVHDGENTEKLKS